MKLIDQTTLTQYALPELVWVDEFDWQPVVATSTWSITGALLTQAGTKQKGRPITLEPADDEMHWIKRTLLVQLQSIASLADRKFQLVVGSAPNERTFIVRFRHEDKALEAKPVYRWQPTTDDAYYLPTLRLLEVE